MSYMLDNFLNEFKDYLKNHYIRSNGQSLAASTINGYPNCVRRACVRVYGDEDLIEKIATESDVLRQLAYCDDLINEIDARYSAGTLAAPAKTVRNDKTVIRRLKEFVSFRAGTILFTPRSTKKPTLGKRKSVYKTTKPCINGVIKLGKDMPSPHVSYDNVPDEKQVVGLCSIIEEYYSAVLSTAGDIFGGITNFPLDDQNKIPVKLSPECPTMSWPKGDRYIAGEIAKAMREKGESLTTEEIYNILKNKDFVDRVGGQFIAGKRPYIVIYYNNFAANSWREYLAKILNVLAHEYMHYLEFSYCRSMGVAYYTNEFLSEAMADFFGVVFSLNCSLCESKAVARARYNKWVDRYGTGWPYAEALYFYLINGVNLGFSDDWSDYLYSGRSHTGSVIKLRRVFKKCFNPIVAYQLLVN